MSKGVLSFLKDSAITVFIGLLMLLLFEGAIRIFSPQTQETIYENNESLGIQDRQLGYAYRPGAKSRVTGPEFSVEYKINREGLRDETEHPLPKPNGRARVLLLGDSFTFGVGGSYDKIWPVLLEKRLAEKGIPMDVVKAGAAAFDTQTELIYLTRLFPRYEPDLVVVGFLPNDLHTNAPLVGADFSTIQVAPNENNITIQARGEKNTALHSVALLKRLLMRDDLLYSKLYRMTARAEFFRKPKSPLLTRQMGVTQELFLALIRYCRERNVDLLVLSIPQQVQVLLAANDDRFDGMDIHFVDEELGRFAAAQGIRWAPALPLLTEDYRQHREELYYRFDGHLTDRGNERVGAFIFGELEQWYNNRSKTGS
jgi:lysophospholipase L1-like esterase